MPSELSLPDAAKQAPRMFDGGMGTQLIAAGLTTADCAVQWNVDKTEVVADVHRRYCNAGCEIITTNTFQGTRTALAMHGLSDRCAELNHAAAKLARGVAEEIIADQQRPVWVAADVGPFGGFLEPLGDTTIEELKDIFMQQYAALYGGGADVALVETMSDPQEVDVAIKAAKAIAKWPVVATLTFQVGGDQLNTMMGVTAEQAVKQAIDSGADIVGSNCGTALDLPTYVKLAEQLVKAAGDVPVVLQPNAGAPQQRGDETVYLATPEDMAEIVPQLLNVGVRVIGGCCGTTPDHLAAMAKAMKAAC